MFSNENYEEEYNHADSKNIKIKLESQPGESHLYDEQQCPLKKRGIVCTENDFEFEDVKVLKSEIKVEETQVHIGTNSSVLAGLVKECFVVLNRLPETWNAKMKRSKKINRKEKSKRCAKNPEWNGSMHETQVHSAMKPFACSECGKRFPLKATMKEHKKIHSNVKEFACDFCSVAFKTKLYLNAHRRLHTMKRTVACSECPKKFINRTHFNKHFRRVHLKPFACDDCPRKFLLETSLKNHERTHTAIWSKPKTYECYLCRFARKDLRAIRSHIKTHVDENLFACNQCPKRLTTEVGFKIHKLTHTERKRLFECGECNKRFYNKAQLAHHKRVHLNEKKFKCDRCPRSFKFKEYLKNHQKTDCCNRVENYLPKNAKFECYLCLFAPKNISKLRSHMNRHVGARRFHCTECPKKYTTNGHLNEHIHLKHRLNGENEFLCMVCSKRFANKGYLIRHALLHTGEKPYSCDECPKTFAHPSNLSSHKKWHRGEKNFCCSKCSRRFVQRSKLKIHERTHDTNNRKFIFTCTDCPKKYSSNEALKTHRRAKHDESPLPFSCDQCPKRFVLKFLLHLHQKSHRGEQPGKRQHSCDQCGLKFKLQRDVAAHKERCVPKPFICKFCSKRHKSESELNTHTKTHTYCGPSRFFECYLCKYTCKIAYKLNKHMIIHNGNYPHRCNQCKRNFMHISFYNKHKPKCERLWKQKDMISEFKIEKDSCIP